MSQSVRSYSVYGSYMSIYSAPDNKELADALPTGNVNDPVYLINNHGRARTKTRAFKLYPAINNKECDYYSEVKYDEVLIKTSEGNVGIIVTKGDEYLIKSTSKTIDLFIDVMPKDYYDSIVELKAKNGRKYFLATSYQTLTRYLIYANKGDIILEQNYQGDEYAIKTKPISRLLVKSQNGFEVVMRAFEHNTEKIVFNSYNYNAIKKAHHEEFETFYNAYPKCPSKYRGIYKDAIYNIWQGGFSKHDNAFDEYVTGMVFENKLYHFENGLVTYGLMPAHKDLALKEILYHFHYQDEDGCVPGTISDFEKRFTFMKPPAQGLILKHYLKKYDVSKKDAKYIYDHLSASVNWWFKYRDSDGDGICEYLHGNDSDLDNCSNFDCHKAVDSPDLTAHLINDIDVIIKMSSKLKMKKEEDYWTRKLNKLINKSIKYFFDENDNLISRETLSKKAIPSTSFGPYMILTIGEHLPKYLADKLVSEIEKYFACDYGVASERFDSPLFDKGQKTFFRGKIIFHQMFIIDAVKELGYEKLATKLAKGYLDMINTSGITGSYNAFDGAPFDASFGMGTTSGNVIHIIDEYKL